MDIEQFISASLKRILDDEEIKWLTIVDVLHKNINILIDKSDQWFDNNIPSEYKQVIRSLVSIATAFVDLRNDYRSILEDEKKVEIKAGDIIKASIESYNTLIDTDQLNPDQVFEDICIYSSPKMLKKALLSIFLSFSLFWKSNTTCSIDLREEQSSILIEIYYTNLNTLFPGIYDIQKVFFHYQDKDEYKIGIGIHSALYNIRNIGSIVRVSSRQMSDDCSITLSFPSIAFLQTIKKIRDDESLKKTGREDKGEVVIMIKDVVTEVILCELLRENGYTIKNMMINEFEQCKKCHEFKAFLIDYDYIVQHFISIPIFNEYMLMNINKLKKVFVIYESSEKEEILKLQNEHFILCEKPLVIDSIIKQID